MNNRIQGVFLGSAAARYIGLGFLPKWVKIRNMTDAAIPAIEWNEDMGVSAISPEGILTSISTGNCAMSVLVKGAGIIPYVGGTAITAAAATSIVHKSLAQDPAVFPGVQGDQRGAGASGLITKFTVGNSGNSTGNFDNPVNTTYVGVGSPVIIAGQRYHIVAITSTGAAANQVTLDRTPGGNPIPGKDPYGVEYIGNMYDFVNAPTGIIMPAGIYLAETSSVNASAKLCLIEAR